MDYRDLKEGRKELNFWFRNKTKLIEILMKRIFKNRKSLKILNIGVGTGDDLSILNKYGQNYIIDIDKRAIDMIKKGLYIEKKVCDACNLPYKDNFFDVVISLDVFEHIENDKKAVSEVHRVLKKNGALIFAVPAFQKLYSSHDKALEHKRRYNKEGLLNLLISFRKINVYYWNSILFFPIAISRILNKGKKAEVDDGNVPEIVDKIFSSLLDLDNKLIKKNKSMPIGLSIVGFCFK